MFGTTHFGKVNRFPLASTGPRSGHVFQWVTIAVAFAARPILAFFCVAE